MIMTADCISFSFAQEAIRRNIFRLLPGNAGQEDISEAIKSAEDLLRHQESAAYEMLNRSLLDWRSGLWEASVLERYLSSGENLQEVLHNGILPEDRPLWLLRIHLLEPSPGNRWQEPLMQMMLTNNVHHVSGKSWRSAPAAALGHDTYCVFIWSADELAAADPGSILEKVYTLCITQINNTPSLQMEGPMDIRNVPQMWRSLSLRDQHSLPEAADVSVSPETLMWRDILKGKKPQRLMNHLHKYIAGRWGGYPPSREELQMMYLQLVQAVDLAVKKKDFWAELLTDSTKYDIYLHGSGTLEAFFAFANMTVGELVRMQNNPEVTLTERVTEYLEKHIDQELRCTEIAEEFKMNPDHLTRLFRKETGISLKSFILSYKMDHARRLLKLTSMPVSQVAEKVGFVSFSHFSAAFRKTFGESPTQTRSNVPKS